MDRRDFLKAVGAGAALLALPGGLTAAASSAKQPNILFVFADDQTFEGIRALGNDEIETPNLDKLVANGVTFTHAYNQKVNSKVDKRFTQGGKYWSQLIDSAGYDTYMTGKWHVKADASAIFDQTTHIRGGMPRQTKQGYNRPIEGKPDPLERGPRRRRGRFYRPGLEER